MEEKKELMNKLITHTLLNIVVFAIIFSVFGVFIFFTVKHYTYSSVDTELERSKIMILNEISEDKPPMMPKVDTMEKENLDQIFGEGVKEKIEEDAKEIQKFNKTLDLTIESKIRSPRVITIIRDEDGNILNSANLGRIGNYIDEISDYSSNDLKIKKVKIANEYNYRMMNVKYTDESGVVYYVQLLVNSDSEELLIQNYGKMISYAIALGILLSLLASILLSKITLKPLEESFERQSKFVQDVSHELRTPLTIIQAKQELLLQEPNAKIIDKSEDIMLTLSETKRLTKLTKDLLMLSRADTNRIALNKEKVDFDEFVKGVVTPYQELAEMQSKKITLDLNYGNDAEIDTNRIYQLIVILLDNALKYTGENDSIEVATRQKDNKCILEVKDTGVGVSDEGLKKIFERFYREEQSRNRETGGNGLGLSIASMIVTAHNGTIRASHNNPKGTIFTIRLPK
jgi:two-component system sensor histidine kinase CiaH